GSTARGAVEDDPEPPIAYALGAAAALGLAAWQLVVVNEVCGKAEAFGLFAGLLAVVVATVVVHEFGHLLGVWAVGLRCEEFAVGPLRVVRDDTGFRVEWCGFDPNVLGLVRPTTADARDSQLAVMLAAGPVANLAVAATCLAVSAGLPVEVQPHSRELVGYAGLLPRALTPGSLTAGWLNTVVAISGGLGLCSFLPARVGQHAT